MTGSGEGNSDPDDALTAVNEDLIDDRSFPDCERVRYESAGHNIDAITYLPPEFDPESTVGSPRATS